MGYLNSASYDDDDFGLTAATNGTTEPPTPSWSSGLLSAPFRGVASAMQKTATAIGAAASLSPALPDEDQGPLISFGVTPGGAPDPFSGLNRPDLSKYVSDRFDAFANPSPATQGDGARMAQGITEGLTLGVAGGAVGGPAGAAALLGGVEGRSTYDDMKKQGVDDETAIQEGILSGAVNAASAFIPMRLAGTGIVSSLLTGAGVNTVLGAAQRAATGTILQSNGYAEMASQYKVFDWNAAMSDALLGAAFGGYGKLMGHGEAIDPKAILPEDIDQAQVIQSEQHVQRDMAPGIATDPGTETLHATTAQDSIQDLLLRGDVPDIQPDHANLLGADLIADPRKDDASPPLIDDAYRADQPGIEDEAAFPEMRTEADLEREEAGRTQAIADANATAEETPRDEVQQPNREEGALQAEPAPQISSIHQDMLSQLEARHGDMPIDLGDGKMGTINDVRQMLADNGVQAQKDADLHDVAAACFIRGQ